MKTEYKISAALYGLAFLAAIFSYGCGANVLETANSARVASPAETAVHANPLAESILVEAFSRTDVQWDERQRAEAMGALEAIKSQFAFLKKKQEIDGTVPYYSYKSSLEVIGYNYGILQDILDERVEAGALDEKEAVIYAYVVRDIAVKLEIQRVRTAEAEADINNRADAMNAEQLKGVWNNLKPLIDLAL